jgi:5,10-methylenetetrahydrofolate reductase
LPLFSPKPFQGAYHPVEPDRRWLIRLFTALERVTKGALFGCRMCGNCILQETAYICPMTCAKGLRNGFCGEATEERCVVDANRPCTWLLIFRRAERLGRLEKLLEVSAPIDGAQAGHSAWIPLLRQWAVWKKPSLSDFVSDRKSFNADWGRLCSAVRQPDWWQGDSQPHLAGYTEPNSGLEAALRTRSFVVTGEIEPLMDNDTQKLISKIELLRRYVVAVNYSDNAFAVNRMSSLASSLLSLENGLEPVMQIQARDRSRNGILSDVMGASALGIRNILCLGGNYHNNGPRPHPFQPTQFDLDSVQMLWMLRRLRDEGRHPDGREVAVRPQYFLGAAGAPFTLKPAYNAIRTEKKINAGAQFIQTQMVFDVVRFSDWLEALDKRSLLDRAFILPGVCPPRSLEDTLALAREPGIYIPPATIKRMQQAARRDREDKQGGKHHQTEESAQIAAEIIGQLSRTPGIRGVHLMLFGQEEVIPRLFELANLEGAS